MANNDANMGWGDREEVPNEAEGDARRAGEGPDGRDGGRPETRRVATRLSRQGTRWNIHTRYTHGYVRQVTLCDRKVVG